MTQGDLDFTAPAFDAAEIKRRAGNKGRLWAVLQDGNAHDNSELIEVAGFRYGARLMELRRELSISVHVFACGGGRFRYRYDPDHAYLPDCVGPCCRRAT